MITEKTNYGNINGVTVVEFGKGTLSVTNGINPKGHKSLLIKQSEFSPIGEKGDFHETSDDFKPEIVIVFHNIESFEVFKEYVNNIDAEFSSENEL